MRSAAVTTLLLVVRVGVKGGACRRGSTVRVTASVLCELRKVTLWAKPRFLKLYKTHRPSRTPLFQWSARHAGRYLQNTKRSTREEHPCHQRDSKLRFQKSRSCKLRLWLYDRWDWPGCIYIMSNLEEWQELELLKYGYISQFVSFLNCQFSPYYIYPLPQSDPYRFV
jgi:hypothetical protein